MGHCLKFREIIILLMNNYLKTGESSSLTVDDLPVSQYNFFHYWEDNGKLQKCLYFI